MEKLRNKASWKEWLEMMQNLSFELGLSNHFIGKSQEEEYQEEECILFNKDKGLLAYASTCKGELHIAKLYGQLVIQPNVQAEQKWDALHLCNYDAVDKDGRFFFNLDVTKEFSKEIAYLSKCFDFSKSWSKVPSMSFFNYMENENENDVVLQKINNASSEVKNIIFEN